MRYLILTFLAFLLIGSSVEDARKANEAYNNSNYEKAIKLYKKAIDTSPKNAKLYYNLASAQAKAGKKDEALRTYEQFKSMTNDAERRAMANYDIGNIYAQSKKWGKALDYYKKSLRYMADDPDAKHNYELAQKKNQDRKDKKNKKNQKNNQNKNKKQNNKQKQQQKNKQKQQQKGQDQQQQQKSQNEQQKKKKKQSQKSKISKAEAKKILKALEQKEKDLLKKFKKRKMKSGKSTNEKDW